ncbi:MAG: MotA/TolQ/ExbB proton channel family protein [Flavobacteriales bacterium]|jgi:biopolymer transport protein ExbB|nr:MotA/TolQ/ExbB proton channel family protein [Flavobacteriales bacterium]MBK9512148.1 MotA/TolQ/ExbB proton channel family protein [Flavobacteriales bacterium]MBP7450290.1 MotA/TolQ/ExbB proton channel family protein [Flavobacteriales bacterium]HOZ40242.1 MotA/TolQ/ExbB proton channel family protein [Flavobacteriales bacterium]
MHFPLFTQIEQSARELLEQQTVATPEPVMETISIWQLIVDGGWYIMGPMGIMSLMAFYIIIERSLAIRRALKEEKDFMNKIKDYIHEGKIDSARNLCAQTSSPISRMLDKGISRIGKPLKDIEVSIENAGKLEIYQLEKGLSVLATIAGAAPMLGFLGTVIGMIVTFHTMKISGAGVEISALSGGIMQAMVTTVAGLVVGIIAYVAYNTLVARVTKVIQNMEATTIAFMDVLDSPAK